jgi:hypothetical protein
MLDSTENSSTKVAGLQEAVKSPSSSITRLVLFRPEMHHHASLDQVRRLSNWQAHMYEDVQKSLSLMVRLPEDHDLHLNADVASRAADILAWIRANTDAEAPKVINEDGDTVLFTWDDGSIKKYLCIDASDVEVEARRKGTPYVASEVIGQLKAMDVNRFSDLLGVRVKTSTAY